MIEDEKGLVSPEIFKKMFFTYFKGERNANQVFDILLPVLTDFYDESSDSFIKADDPRVKYST